MQYPHMKQCHFKCNRPHQPMYILGPKFGYYKIDLNNPGLFFLPNMWVLL